MKSLAETVWTTVHRSKLSVPELADTIGCSTDLLYKAASVNEPTDLKLSWLIPLMRATRNYAILQHLASRLGFVLVKLPRTRALAPAEIADHQRTLADYQAALIRFCRGEADGDAVHELVEKTLREVAAAKKMVETDNPQTELFEEE